MNEETKKLMLEEGFKLVRYETEGYAVPFSEYSYNDNLVLWLSDDSIITSMWRNKGSTAINKYKKIIITKELLQDIKTNIDKLFCSSCNKELSEYAGRHFAGVYCSNCWENYKKENSRRCGICGAPLYECCC